MHYYSSKVILLLNQYDKLLLLNFGMKRRKLSHAVYSMCLLPKFPV